MILTTFEDTRIVALFSEIQLFVRYGNVSRAKPGWYHRTFNLLYTNGMNGILLEINYIGRR